MVEMRELGFKGLNFRVLFRGVILPPIPAFGELLCQRLLGVDVAFGLVKILLGLDKTFIDLLFIIGLGCLGQRNTSLLYGVDCGG